LFVAVVMGFMTGMLRSLATIFGYLAAATIAVVATPCVSRLFTGVFHLPPTQPWIEFVAVFLVAGLVLSALCRAAVNELVGARVSIPDRVAGALLGAVRVGLLAVVLVLVFDRIIPPGREPAFLHGSQWRPVLSNLGQQG
jgi:membrane protein required for colicin V production